MQAACSAAPDNGTVTVVVPNGTYTDASRRVLGSLEREPCDFQRKVRQQPTNQIMTNSAGAKRGSIAILHHVGGGNLGDDATLDTVMKHIRRRRPRTVIVALTMNPEDTSQRHGVTSYPITTKPWTIGYARAASERSLNGRIKALVCKHRLLLFLARLCYDFVFRAPKSFYSEIQLILRSRRLISSFESLIISGGGQLTEKDGSWAFPYRLFKWVLLAKSARVSCFFLNVGAGPLSYPWAKFFVRRALALADYVSFRDQRSRALVSQIGFKGSCQVYPDCVYSREIPISNRDTVRDAGQLTVGIAPMPYWGSPTNPERNQAEYQEFIKKLAAFGALLVKNSYALSLFGTDIGCDPAAISDLRLALLTNHNVATAEYDPVNSIDDLLSKMSSVDYVLTCRFHGVIFAHLLNKPILALSPHPKVRTLMSDLGLTKYCMEIQTFEAVGLFDTFKSLVADEDEIKRRMTANLADYRSQLITQFDELFAA